MNACPGTNSNALLPGRWTTASFECKGCDASCKTCTAAGAAFCKTCFNAAYFLDYTVDGSRTATDVI